MAIDEKNELTHEDGVLGLMISRGKDGQLNISALNRNFEDTNGCNYIFPYEISLNDAIERIIIHLQDVKNYKKFPYVGKSSDEVFGRDQNPL